MGLVKMLLSVMPKIHWGSKIGAKLPCICSCLKTAVPTHYT